MENGDSADDGVISRLDDEARGEAEESEPADEAVRRMCKDLVTPAAAIGHLAESIASDPAASPRSRHWAEMIVLQSNLVSEICEFTLGVGRSSHPVRLDQLVSECVWGARSWFRGTIEERIDPVTVSAERVPMLRLVTNLLTIACQSTGPSGSVRIAVGHDGSLAHIDVVTTGARPEPALLSYGPEGSDDLGWRIVWDIVNDHNGRIRIEPGAFGGTSVQVEIPLDATGNKVTTDD